ncbi:peptide chain release factor N(5)-glutamine methyltransferase [soil metagenome]
MKTVLETIQSGTAYLEKHGVESARLNMEQLLASVLGCARMQLYVDFDRPLDEPVLAPLRELVRRRKERVPLQHLLASVPFFGRDFQIDGRALIPRPETEELVERVVGRVAAGAKEGGKPPGRVADIGCGSGVIGLTLVDRLGVPGVLADISHEALALARTNAGSLGLADRVTVVESDLFAALGGEVFDVVAANLPYVASGELADLEPEVAHDSAVALDGGSDGLEVMERFIDAVAPHVAEGGLVAMEIGAGQGQRLKIRFDREPIWDVSVERDLSGNERFVFAVKRGAPPA